MRFLADMGIFPVTVRHLRALGHDVVHLADEGLFRLADLEVVLKARREARVILTTDLDFSDPMAAAKESQPSVIIFRLACKTPPSINAALTRILPQFEEQLRQGVILSVAERSVRARTLPLRPTGPPQE